MGFMGRIDLLSPEVTMGCFEECEPRSSIRCCCAVPKNETHALIVNVRRTDSGVRGTTRHEHEGAGELREVFFGRLVRKACRGTFFCLSERRYLCPDRARQCASSGQNIRRQKTAIFWQYKHGSRDISSHGKSNLGTATYITPSTITLSPGHVFHTTPLAARQASPGKLIYDPFVGTGSMAYVCRPPLLIFAPIKSYQFHLVQIDDRPFRCARIWLRHRRQTDARKR